MTTFTWNINNLTAFPQLSGYDDVVFRVYWCLQAQETVDLSAYVQAASSVTYNAVSYGEVDLLPLDIQSFTPYPELTKDQVLGWIMPFLDVPALTANLQNLIDQQKNPIEINLPPPWNNTPVPTTTTSTTVAPATTVAPVPSAI